MKFCLSLFFLYSISLFAAPQYVRSPALTKVVPSTVTECSPKSTIQVPLITWGADLVTVYANGNKKTTNRGSIFGKKNLKLKLVREDVFAKQVQNYMSCVSPFLRCTAGMCGMAQEVTDKDPRTKMVAIYQHSWSNGGDALVVKGSIKTPRDLKGKTVAVQAYGPHVDYLTKTLTDAGLKLSDVKIKWTKDLTGTDETPVTAMYSADVDAAMVIIPDALALSSNGTVGTGSEDSIKGAHILLSTKTANRVISDLYFVRADFLEQNRDLVFNFTHGLMLATEQLGSLFKNKKKNSTAYQQMISASADILLDSAQAVKDTEAMYADAELVGWRGNVKFFGDKNYPRNLENLFIEIQGAFISLGLRSKKLSINHAKWDFSLLKKGIANTSGVEVPRFNQMEVSRVVSKMTQQGSLEDGELFSFEVYFKPNQNNFSATQYAKFFDKAIELSSTYGGALITVEGHSDSLGYLKKKKSGSNSLVLNRAKQAAVNLSLTRANAVRDSLVNYSASKKITLDPSQFAVVGHGISKPSNGSLCGNDPCPPKTKQEWLNNMRVKFRIIQIEAEASVFTPI